MKRFPSRAAAPHRTAGITLIELIIVLTILGIVAMVSYASYTHYVFKVNRSVAKSVLLDTATRQERFYAGNRRYANDMTELGYSTSTPCFGKDGSPLASCSDAIYSVRTESSCDGGPLPCFKVSAAPAGVQVSDTTCGTFRIFSTNVRTAGAGGCW